MILFLDFDGVLHPGAVFKTRRGIELRGEGSLFMWSPILEKLLAECPQTQIVLSTSWVRQLDFKRAKKRLSESVQARVIGATYHSALESGADSTPWMQCTRWQQIAGYLARNKVQDWIALDDDDAGWPEDQRHRLLRCDPQTGLAGLDYDVTRMALRTCGKARREEAVKYARATSALEGIRQSPEGAEQGRRYIAGEITVEQAIEETKARYRKEPAEPTYAELKEIKKVNQQRHIAKTEAMSSTERDAAIEREKACFRETPIVPRKPYKLVNIDNLESESWDQSPDALEPGQ